MITLKQIKHRLQQNPNDAEAHWQYGCFLAFTGDWNNAWPELEWRFKGNRIAMMGRAEYSKPDWDGNPTKLLVYQDQGFGDLFQYSRYLPMLEGCEVILECAPAAVNLMKMNFEERPPYAKVICKGDALPEHDHVVAVCSLPYFFRNIMSYESYFFQHKTDKFKLENAKKKIGIAWSGNPDYYDDGTRSCDPGLFMALQDCGELVSLMIRKVDLPFVDFSLKIVDFVDTADIINSLDCVVTVDTAVGHLAGALGKPVYLALSYEHDWRWMANRTDTPWYLKTRIFRQPTKGDWTSVFNEIKGELL